VGGTTAGVRIGIDFSARQGVENGGLAALGQADDADVDAHLIA
jgi:hypothetical protein